MEPILAIAILLILAFLGVRIGVATMLVGISFFALDRGAQAAMAASGQRILSDVMNYNLTVVPLFILMGVFIYKAEVASELYNAANRQFSRLRGGLAQSTIVASGGFAAVCGSSLAAAATMTKVAIPSMRRFGYSDRLSTGAVAAGGTLGIMIPPSVPMVIFGIVAEVDIGQLFLAGVLPGLLLVTLFMLTVAVWVRLKPSDAPSSPPEAGPAQLGSLPLQKRERSGVLPILGLFFLILGGIYGGLFTPTEAAGVGALGAALVALFRGKLRKPSEWLEVLSETAQTTAALFFVFFGSMIFAQYINLSGMPYDIRNWVDGMGLSPIILVAIIAVIAIIMGMVFDSIGIIVLLVPVFMPSLLGSGVDLIWFGIIIVLVTELGLITPPVGMNVFVVKSVLSNARLQDMFVGVMPFVGAMLIALILLMIFPWIATAIPNLAR